MLVSRITIFRIFVTLNEESSNEANKEFHFCYQITVVKSKSFEF